MDLRGGPARQRLQDRRTAEARKHPNFPFYGSDIKLQTRFVLENLKKTFEAAGSSLDNVFKAQVFLTDLDDFFAFDEVWKEYFKVPPARTTVGTTGLLVKDTLIEIDLIGFVPGKGVEKQVIKSNAPRPLAHYNEGFKIGDLVYRRRTDRQRLQDRRSERRHAQPEFSLLQVRHQAADPLHP